MVNFSTLAGRKKISSNVVLWIFILSGIALCGCSAENLSLSENEVSPTCQNDDKLWEVSTTQENGNVISSKFECNEYKPQGTESIYLKDLAGNGSEDIGSIKVTPYEYDEILKMYLPDVKDDQSPSYIFDDNRDLSDSNDIDTVKSGPWGRIDLSDDVGIEIYESSRNEAWRNANQTDKLRYFYSPPFTINREKVVVTNYDRLSTVTFPVYMEADGVVDKVRKQIQDLEKIDLLRSQILRLPINTIEMSVYLPPKHRNVALYYPKGNGVLRFNRLFRPIFEFENQSQAQSFAQNVKDGKVRFSNTLFFSGVTTQQNIFSLRISGETRRSIKNKLNGNGSRTHATRHQLSEAIHETFMEIRAYKFAEFETKNSVLEQAISKLLADSSFGTKLVEFSEINESLTESLSRYLFDQEDMKAEKITRTLIDIKNSETRESANSKKIGGRAEAGFLGFKASGSGNYESTSSFKSMKENAFKYEQEGDVRIPKWLKIYSLTEANVSTEIVISFTNAIARDGEGKLIIDRWASDAIDLEVLEAEIPPQGELPTVIGISRKYTIPSGSIQTKELATNIQIFGGRLQIHFEYFCNRNNTKLSVIDQDEKVVWDYNGAETRDFWTPVLDLNAAYIKLENSSNKACRVSADKVRVKGYSHMSFP